MDKEITAFRAWVHAYLALKVRPLSLLTKHGIFNEEFK